MDYVIVPMSMEHYQEAYDLWKRTEGIGLTATDSREGTSRYLAHNAGLCFVALVPGSQPAGATHPQLALSFPNGPASCSCSSPSHSSHLSHPSHAASAAQAEPEASAKLGLVGTVLCGFDGRRGYLTHLAVDKAHRRKGIGRALVQQAVDAMVGQGIIACNLFVYSDNTEGRRFWESLGWIAPDTWGVMNRKLIDD